MAFDKIGQALLGHHEIFQVNVTQLLPCLVLESAYKV